jgi:hypothetical protein
MIQAARPAMRRNTTTMKNAPRPPMWCAIVGEFTTVLVMICQQRWEADGGEGENEGAKVKDVVGDGDGDDNGVLDCYC